MMTVVTINKSNKPLLTQLTAGLLMAAFTIPALAMLPTPEPELDSPSTLETAAIAQQNTVNNSANGGSLSAAQAIMRTPANAAPINYGASNAEAVTKRVTAALVGTDANGQEVLVPVDANTRLQPGSIVEYHGYFTNTNKDRVRKMTVTMGIPESMDLVKVVEPQYPFASVDGKMFARMPLQTVINGQRQDVPLGYYRAIRWDVEGLGLNDTLVVKYRAKVK